MSTDNILTDDMAILYQVQRWPSCQNQFDLIVTGLRRRKVVGAVPCAKAALEILRTVIGQCKFLDLNHMVTVVRAIGRLLTKEISTELTVGNIIRRVLYLIREEYSNKVIYSNEIQKNAMNTKSESVINRETMEVSLSYPGLAGRQVSLGSVLSLSSEREKVRQKDHDIDRSIAVDSKQSIISGIQELSDEIDNSNQSICEMAVEYIHADEVILTFGYSLTVELFLKAAARKRKFQLIVAESGPSLEGHKLVNSLSRHPNITTALIPDSALYALMSRVNKVVFSPHAILADGGAVCSTGHLMLAIAAKSFAVPVVGVTGSFKLSPLFSHNQSNVLNHLLSPSEIMTYNNNITFENVRVIAPAFDFLPPELITLYVTNNGSHQPSYMYRLLGEFYYAEDYDLDVTEGQGE